MRIGIFTACYHPTVNGVVVSIDTFKNDLEKVGHQYYIFAPGSSNFKDTSPKVFRYPSWPYWPAQSNYPLAMPMFAPLQSAKIKDLRLDIIHLQHMFSMGNLGLKIGRDLDIPVVYTYHTLIEEYTHYVPVFPKISRKIIINISRKFCNKCDQVITPSEAMKKILREYGVKRPIETIPTGVDLDKYQNPYNKEVFKTKWNIPEDSKILLYISRISKEKNLNLLFGATKILSEKRKDFHLVLVGGGPELNYFQKKVKRLRLDHLITFTGMQPPEIARRIFGIGDIFVFPSITETQGIVVTEAMASRVPVVAVNKMGPSNLIKNNEDGFLVRNNAEEFAQKVETLLSDQKLRNKMSNSALTNAKLFSTSVCAKKMENLYVKTISNYRSQ